MMLKTLLKFTLTFSVIATITQTANAQKKPLAVLVMLNSEQNRIKFAEGHNRGRELQEIKNDAASVVRVTKNDFRDHFDYCPVYYFVDSNMSKIKAQNFEGIVTNADGTPVADIPHDFIVAYYGYPLTPRSEDERLKKTMVVTDGNLKQLYSKPPFLVSRHFRKKERKIYNYVSRNYDIDYKAIADNVQSYCRSKW